MIGLLMSLFQVLPVATVLLMLMLEGMESEYLFSIGIGILGYTAVLGSAGAMLGGYMTRRIK
jgi:hypothetical protein